MTVYFSSTRKQWRYDFRKNGKRRAGYCCDPETGEAAKNRTAALNIETKIKARYLSAKDGGRNSVRGYTWAQALASYAGRVSGGANWRNQKRQIDELLEYFGADRLVSTFDEGLIWGYIQWARQQPVYVWAGGPLSPTNASEAQIKRAWKKTSRIRTDATINRSLAVVCAALNIAKDVRDPVTGGSALPQPPKVPVLKETRRLPNPVPLATVRAVLNELPPMIADAVALNALTGMRKGELLLRRPEDYRADLRALHIPGEQTKGKRDEFIPLPAEAVVVVERRVAAAIEAGSPWLFFVIKRHGTRRIAHRVKDFRKSWRGALARKGLPHYRIHDLKATFVTAVYEATGDKGRTQEAGRHKNSTTTDRYIAVVDGRRHQAAESAAAGMTGFGSIRRESAGKVVAFTHKSLTQEKTTGAGKRKKALK